MNATEEKPKQIKRKLKRPSPVRDGLSQNGSGTYAKGDTPVTQDGSRFDPKVLCNQLIAMRDKYGAQSAIGDACSLLITQLRHRPITKGEFTVNLDKRIRAQVKRLAELTGNQR